MNPSPANHPDVKCQCTATHVRVQSWPDVACPAQAGDQAGVPSEPATLRAGSVPIAQAGEGEWRLGIDGRDP